ncbi:GntR family transcriptional regulator [Ruminococcaceae bacterium OttesenSCG-928-I18]|nr:GntR family transcriptional regulator [Ruminococcaceae bacterium OttesenSCG-928-I18]
MEKHKYIRLADTIRESIEAEEYPVGKPLPGERELAEKYQCSRQTVRKAIGILCEEKVLKQVHGSGNFVLKKARRPGSGLVAVIATHIALPNFTKTLLSMENTLIDGGYYPVIATTDNYLDAERKVVEDLLGKNVDGIIVEGVQSSYPNPNIDLYREMDAQGIPFVFINTRYKELEKAVFVGMDNMQGGALMGQYLLSKGHTNFAGIFKSDDQTSIERYSGFARYVSERGSPPRDSNLLWYTTMSISKLIDDFAVSCVENCSAVACFNDEIAFMLYETLDRKGVKIPDGFEFVAFDKTEFSQRIPHKITTLAYPQEAIGKLTARKIIHLIEGKSETSARLRWQLYDAKGNIFEPME